MAITAIKGYQKAVDDYEYRQNNNLCWNDDTLRYENTDHPQPDEFMALRIRKMQKIAKNLRPTLLSAKQFAPNKQAKEKAQYAIELYNACLGKPSWKTQMASLFLTVTAVKETSLFNNGKTYRS